MERIPKSGEFYRHFKNKLYQVITVATHSETGEQLVVYQALYGDFKVYARPLAMFVSEVDREKYPDAAQQYRFERVEISGADCAEPENSDSAKAEDIASECHGVAAEADSVSAVKTESAAAEPEDTIHPKVLAFLDTEDFDERYNLLVSLRDEINDQMIDTLAVALDVVIPDGGMAERYEELKRCLRTRQKYESTRLR